jgi:hypothetical protein
MQRYLNTPFYETITSLLLLTPTLAPALALALALALSLRGF